MRNLPLLAATLAACGRLPHVPPEPRSPSAQRMTVIAVHSTCSEPDMTSPEWNSDVPGEREMAPEIDWMPPSWGTGVVISENAALTAAHVVRCPVIPAVTVYLPDRSTQSMQVDRDAAMFGDGTDLAHLEIVGAYDRFGIGVPPPSLVTPGYNDFVCIQPYGRAEVCGQIVGMDLVGAKTFPGDSGAPVYDTGYDGEGMYSKDGGLIGLVVAGGTMDGKDVTKYVPIDPSWLKGT